MRHKLHEFYGQAKASDEDGTFDAHQSYTMVADRLQALAKKCGINKAIQQLYQLNVPKLPLESLAFAALLVGGVPAHAGAAFLASRFFRQYFGNLVE